MLFAIQPRAIILTTIRPVEDTMAFLFVINIITFIATIIRPVELAKTFHFVIFPLSFVDSAVSPFILSFTFDVVLDKVTMVFALIRPGELTNLQIKIPKSMDENLLGFQIIRNEYFDETSFARNELFDFFENIDEI